MAPCRSLKRSLKARRGILSASREIPEGPDQAQGFQGVPFKFPPGPSRRRCRLRRRQGRG
jgi:hypothetical protein